MIIFFFVCFGLCYVGNLICSFFGNWDFCCIWWFYWNEILVIGWCEKCILVEIRYKRGNIWRIDLKECVYMYILVIKIKEKKFNVFNLFVVDVLVWGSCCFISLFLKM